MTQQDALEALGELVAACEREFMSEATENEDDEFNYEPDDSEVALPSSHITFGMIRRAREALTGKAIITPPDRLWT